MPQHPGGLPPKWPDEKLMGAISEAYSKHGRITPALLKKENRGAYDHLGRCVRKGEFGSISEAIKKILLQWFLNLTNDKAAELDKAAGWIVERASQRDLEPIRFLSSLLDSEAGPKAEWVLKRISNSPAARRIIVESLELVDLEEGEKVKSLLKAPT